MSGPELLPPSFVRGEADLFGFFGQDSRYKADVLGFAHDGQLVGGIFWRDASLHEDVVGFV